MGQNEHNDRIRRFAAALADCKRGMDIANAIERHGLAEAAARTLADWYWHQWLAA